MEFKDPELRLVQNHRPLTSVDVHLEDPGPRPLNRGRRQSLTVTSSAAYQIVVKRGDRIKTLMFPAGTPPAKMAAAINNFHQRAMAEAEGSTLHVWEDGLNLPSSESEPEEIFTFPDVSGIE